jgi:hypothetical protein
MKKTILGLIFITLIQLAHGQDRIVTAKSDLNTTKNTGQKNDKEKIGIAPQSEKLNKKSKFMVQAMSGYGYLIGSTTASRNQLASYGLDLETAN